MALDTRPTGTPVRPLPSNARERLAARIRHARDALGNAALIPSHPPGEPARLSLAEEQLWFLEQVLGGTPTYTICRAWRILGPLDRTALRVSADELVERHPNLRSTVAAHTSGAIRVVHPASGIAWRSASYPEIPAEEREAEATRLAREAAVEPFNLETGPLVRLHLCEFDANDHLLVITLHHIIADGWSLGVLLNQLTTLYRAHTSGVGVSWKPPAREYADFATWQHQQARAGAFDLSLSYWEDRMRDAPPVLDLPTDRPRPGVPTYRGVLATASLSAERTRTLAEWAAEEQASLFVVMLAAFKVLLLRLTGQEDLVIGSPFASRIRPELEPIVGYFANMLPLRTDLSGSPSFREVVRRVRDAARAAVDHQDVPFAMLVERLRPAIRHAGLNPVFQAAFVLEEKELVGAPRFPGTTAEMVGVDTATAKFDLSLLAIECERGLELTIEANADLFEAATATRLLQQYLHLVGEVLIHPDIPVTEAALMPAAERTRILQQWCGTRTNYPRNATVHGLFAEQARRTPDAPALVMAGRSLTYGALGRAATRLSRHVRDMGVRPGDFVAIAADRSMEFVVAVLAVLKSGAAYVPLDVRHPRAWLARLLEDVRPAAALIARHYADVVPPTQAPVLMLDETTLADGPVETADADAASSAASAAYVMFTSGSTGQPKGTVVPHRAIVRLVRGTDFVRYSPEDVFLLLANLAFDASTFELWGPLLNGARLAIPAYPQPSLAQIADDVRQHKVSTLWLTSGLFNLMVEERPDAFAGVRQLLTGGDALSTTHVAKAIAALPATHLINGYGPTENTVFTTCHTIRPEDVQRRSIPIGRPIANTRVYILDALLQPVPVGIPGELYAAGDGVAQGYLNQPELTEARFLPDPFQPAPGALMYRTGDRCRWRSDGSVEFLGRIDQEVKVRGFRVDPGEIESALAILPGVAEATVVVREKATGEKELLGFVVPTRGASLIPGQVKEQLAGRVPPHMVPGVITVVSAMPLTANGKVDRRVLTALSRDSTTAAGAREYAGPRTETERRLETIWRELLQCEPIDVRDDFFALGGHSLLAMRLLHRIHGEFGQALPLATLFAAPTLERLAARLAAAESSAGAAPTTTASTAALRGSGPGAPLFFVPGLGGYEFLPAAVTRALEGCCPCFDGLQMVGVDRQANPLDDLPAIAADLIRQIRAVRPHGPYALCGYCYGGVVAYEVARQLEEAGETVSALVIWHGYPIHQPWPRRSVPDILRAIRQRILDTPPSARPRMLLDKAVLAMRMAGWKATDLWNHLRGRPRSLIPHNVFFPDVMDPDVVYANLRARGRYQPAPYRGRVYLLLGETDRLLYQCPRLAGWDGLLLGPVEVFQHRVEHMELVVPPAVDYLAAQTAACLTAAHHGVPARAARGFTAVDCGR